MLAEAVVSVPFPRSSVGMDRRRVLRRDVQKEVDVRVRGRSSRATIVDLSTHGCRTETLVSLLRAGDSVTIKFPNNLVIGGEVAWHEGRKAGVKFREPLHDAVVTHLSFKPAARRLQWDLRDQFGRSVYRNRPTGALKPI